MFLFNVVEYFYFYLPNYAHFNFTIMQTVIYNMIDNSIIRITSNEVLFSDLKNNEDFCPLSFYEQTEDGRKALETFNLKQK